MSLNLAFIGTQLKPARALWSLIIVSGALLSAPQTAHAKTGDSLLETIGFSIAVGTVLGASTLPFYDQPGQHTANVLYGALLGTLWGVGSWVANTSAEDGEGDAELRGLAPGNSQQKILAAVAARRRPRVDVTRASATRLTDFRPAMDARLKPADFWMPVVSLTW